MTPIERTGSIQAQNANADRQFVLDAGFIAGIFTMSEGRLRALMARKLFRSLVEKGEDEDAGSWRLTLRCGNRAWQGILSEDGAIRQQTFGVVPPQRLSGHQDQQQSGPR